MAPSPSLDSLTLPDPTLTFTIPSLHDDDTMLKCRVYHPLCLLPGGRRKKLAWHRDAVVFAHPYAPLGGQFDDPVVHAVTAVLLQLGYVVFTFNFRGAPGSGGRTSWTSKPEQSDYMSVVGFAVYYLHYLDPFKHVLDHHRGSSETSSTQIPEEDAQVPKTPVLILGGYSYGSLITTRVPPLDSIIKRLENPVLGSPAAEIRLRAQHLAEQQNTVLASLFDLAANAKGIKSPRRSMGVLVGGHEVEDRRSHDSRRSFSIDAEEKIRKGINDLIAKTKAKRRPRQGDGLSGQQSTEVESQIAEEHLEDVPDLFRPREAFILVSPLQGLVSHLATLSLMPSIFSRPHNQTPATDPPQSGKTAAPNPSRQATKPTAKDQAKHAHLSPAETKLTSNQTIALFGDQDVFVAVNKLRSWSAKLQAPTTTAQSKFCGVEVATAGHFWAEGRVLYELRDRVGDFAWELLHGDA